MLYTAVYRSPVGQLTLAGDDRAVTGLWLEGQKYFPAGLPEPSAWDAAPPALRATARWLDAYFAGDRPDPGVLSLAPEGSSFRRTVWDLLRQIPCGTVVTYGWLAGETARRLGRTAMSAQAVGGAVAHNPISIIIPCHRVVGTGGSLTGYAGGVDRKLWLLRHEGAPVDGLTLPRTGTAL